jgi:hypothetical protein
LTERFDRAFLTRAGAARSVRFQSSGPAHGVCTPIARNCFKPAFHKVGFFSWELAMCFSLAWLEQLIIWLIVVGAIIAVIRLLIPFLDSFTGMPIIGRILTIVLYAIIAIAIVVIIFGLLSCLMGGSGILGFPRH